MRVATHLRPRTRVHPGAHWAARAVPMAALLAGLLAAGPAQATTARERLAVDIETQMVNDSYLKAMQIPESDRPRTSQCLGNALVADIPVSDAAELADMLEQRQKPDPALIKQWFTISKKDAPARSAQVLAQLNKTCADLVPYLEPMLK